MDQRPVRDVVIVGAGQAGAETALRLRQNGFAGTITLLGEELLPPYQRPPLSKKYLAGEWSDERLLLRSADTYAEAGIDLRCNARVVEIDRAAQSVQLADGAHLGYDALVLATGTRPRTLKLPGSTLHGIHSLRSAADVEAIRADLRPGGRMVVIGAGYIGLEVAAVARTLGLQVTVLEAASRTLARVTSPEVSAFYLAEHQAHDVDFVLDARISGFEGHDGHVTSVEMADGTSIPADCVVVGIGVEPCTELAAAAGLEIGNGITTNELCQTSDPAIYAIGDCATRPMALYANTMRRLESVHNAIEGGKIVAADIAGTPQPTLETPWFWSDQYDLKLQIAGLFEGYDQHVVRGMPASRSFAIFYFKDGRLIAADAINRPVEFMGAKALIQRGGTADPASLADDSLPARDILRGSVA